MIISKVQDEILSLSREKVMFKLTGLQMLLNVSGKGFQYMKKIFNNNEDHKTDICEIFIFILK